MYHKQKVGTRISQRLFSRLTQSLRDIYIHACIYISLVYFCELQENCMRAQLLHGALRTHRAT